MTVTETLSIRPAVENDAPLIARFGRQAFKAAFGRDNNPEDMEAYLSQAFAPEQVASEIKDENTTFLLAYAGQRMAGYVKLKAGPAPEAVQGRAPIELERIYAAKNLMGKGCGSTLMTACMDHARQNGFKTLWLGVWEQNNLARQFYEKWGFVQASGYKTFTLGNDVQHDIIMERSL